MPKIIETLSPETLPRDRFMARCRDCTFNSKDYSWPWLQGVTRAHVSNTGHTVDIVDQEAEG